MYIALRKGHFQQTEKKKNNICIFESYKKASERTRVRSIYSD